MMRTRNLLAVASGTKSSLLSPQQRLLSTSSSTQCHSNQQLLKRQHLVPSFHARIAWRQWQPKHQAIGVLGPQQCLLRGSCGGRTISSTTSVSPLSLPTIRSFSSGKSNDAQEEDTKKDQEKATQTGEEKSSSISVEPLPLLLERLSKIDKYTLGAHQQFLKAGISEEMYTLLNFVSSGDYYDVESDNSVFSLDELLDGFIQHCGAHTTHTDLLQNASTGKNGIEQFVEQEGITEDMVVELWRNFDTLSVMHKVWKMQQRQEQSATTTTTISREAFQMLVADELDRVSKLWEAEEQKIDRMQKEAELTLPSDRKEYAVNTLSLLYQPASLGFFAHVLEQIRNYQKKQDQLDEETSKTYVKSLMVKQILFDDDGGGDNPYHNNPHLMKQLCTATKALIRVFGGNSNKAESLLPTKDLMKLTEEQRVEACYLAGMTESDLNQHISYLGFLETMLFTEWQKEKAQEIIEEATTFLEPVSLEILERLTSSNNNNEETTSLRDLNAIAKALEHNNEQRDEQQMQLDKVVQAIQETLGPKKDEHAVTDFHKLTSITNQDKGKIMSLCIQGDDNTDDGIVMTRKELDSHMADLCILLGILQHEPNAEEEDEEEEEQPDEIPQDASSPKQIGG